MTIRDDGEIPSAWRGVRQVGAPGMAHDRGGHRREARVRTIAGGGAVAVRGRVPHDLPSTDERRRGVRVGRRAVLEMVRRLAVIVETPRRKYTRRTR